MIVTLAALGWAMTLSAQDNGVHYYHHGIMPPGAIGGQRLQRGGPVAGYHQPVEIKAPRGALISLAENEMFLPPEKTPLRAGMLIGAVYRLRVTNIELAEGAEVFPTIEVVDRIYPPPGQEARFAIPIEITREDLLLALEGKFVTRVIYLEDPQTALSIATNATTTQGWFEAPAYADPLAVGDTLGRPVAILRIGGRLPSNEGQCPDPNFFFGSPPLVRYAAAAEATQPTAPQTPEKKSPAKAEAIPQEPVIRGQAPAAAKSKLPKLPTESQPPAELYSGIVPTGQEPAEPNGPCPAGEEPPAPPLPYQVTGSWSPPGIARPWPRDEYLHDGGTAGATPTVGSQWEVRGMQAGDAIAHFDTLDGRTIVEPSNRVYIYSPRFGAVRQVVSMVATDQMLRAAGFHSPQKLAAPTTRDIVTTSKQHLQPGVDVAALPAAAFRTKQGDGVVSGRVSPRAFQNRFKPFENIAVIRTGRFDGAELAWLARGTTAAAAWTDKQAVQVVLDRKAAMVETGDQKLQSVYTLREPPAHPKLRVIKVASTETAKPGEEVDFTIRFDNVGDQTIGNVTIIDSLTTRLEYVANSAQCSLPAQVVTQPNEGESLVVRCEVTDPLAPGKGGVLRFRCRVR